MMEVAGDGPGSAKGSGSEYKGRYREHDLRQARVRPCKPEATPVTVDAPMESSTTNRRDFTEHPVQKPMPLKPTDNNLRAEGSLDFHSSYSLNFQGKVGERARPIRQDKEREQLGKFEGEPTYKAEYRTWELPPREHRAAEQWVPSTTKMADSTTNRADFREMRPSRRTLVKPAEEMTRSDDPFVGETGYRESFKEHRLEPRAPKAREEWNPPSVKFSHQTTKQNDFKGAYQPKRESCRPERGAFVSDAPFQDSTTNRADFQEKPLGPRHVHRQEEYVKPDGQMDLTTTSHSQFREFPVDGSRQALEKPGSSHILRGTGPMAQTSGYNADFTGPRSPRRELMRPKPTYQPSSDRFEGESTAKRDFVAKQLSPRESYRPTWEPVHSEAPFETSTENRVNFVEQPLPPRRQRAQEVYAGPTAPFKATTTSKESFQGEFAPKRGSFKPSQTAVASEAKFEGRTTFGDDFKRHDVSPRARHQHDDYVPPEGLMDLRTSNQENFRDFGRVRRHVITKPGSSHVLKGEGKFAADSSSYRGDFAAPPPQPRHLFHARSDYQPSQDRFDHVPTYKASFTGPVAPRQASFRPANRPLQDLNGFEDYPPPRGGVGRQPVQPWRDASPYIPPVSV